MTKALHILLLVCIVAIAESCKKGCFIKNDKLEGIIESEYEFGECFSNYSPPDFNVLEFVINDDSTFQSLALELRKNYKSECDSAVPEAIDFIKHTLLGMRTTGGGCSVDFFRKVTKDDAGKKYEYLVRVLECGICSKGFRSMNWVLVPKLPQGYSVEFEVKNR